MASLKFTEKVFGTLCDGTECRLFTVSNGTMSFSCTDYGCTLTSIIIPSKNKNVDVLMGCSTLADCVTSMSSYGTVVGRFANRIGGAKFTLNGTTYNLCNNDGGNTLHGGYDRYEKKVYSARKIRTKNGLGVEFTRLSPDGEQFMPGNVQLKIIYTLNENNELTLEYFAQTDKATPVNLTNHAYFNIKGYDGGSVEDLELKLNSSGYVEVDSHCIPTGKINSVKDNPDFDFTQGKTIGKDIKNTGIGYDHAFCVDGFDGTMRSFGVLKDKEAGVSMEVLTTLPAVQIYTANHAEGAVGKNGYVHHAHDAVCLESEDYPDAPNHDNFPSCIVTPEKPYHSATVYKFGFN